MCLPWSRLADHYANLHAGQHPETQGYPQSYTSGEVALEESTETIMLTLMNAAQVIEEIDALPAKEQEKVIVHVHQLQEAQYHEEQVRIAEKAS